MKKSLLIFVFLISFNSLFSQINNMRTVPQRNWQLGFSIINEDVLNANTMGLYLGYNYNWAHIDFSSNFAKGKGDKLDFESSQTYKEEKRSWFILNFGTNIYVSESFLITPKIGIASIENIYTDPIGEDTYFTEPYKTKLNLGTEIKYWFDKDMAISIGTGLTESFHMSIIMSI